MISEKAIVVVSLSTKRFVKDEGRLLSRPPCPSDQEVIVKTMVSSLRRSHRLVGPGNFSSTLEHSLRFCRREGLRGDRILDASASSGHKCDDRCSLRVWHFRDDHEVVLSQREIQLEQLATRLLAQPRYRRVSVFGLCQPTLYVFAGKAALRDEDRHLKPPYADPCCAPGSAVALDRVLNPRQPLLQIRRRHDRDEFYFRIQSEEEAFGKIRDLRRVLHIHDEQPAALSVLREEIRGLRF